MSRCTKLPYSFATSRGRPTWSYCQTLTENGNESCGEFSCITSHVETGKNVCGQLEEWGWDEATGGPSARQLDDVDDDDHDHDGLLLP
jgi:hypothetical protein